MRSLSILHTVEFYAPHVGGAETVVQKISEGLVQRGHRVTVATTKLPEREFLSHNGVEIVQFDIAGNLTNGLLGENPQRYYSFISAIPADVMLNYAAQQWTADLAFAQVLKGQARTVNVIAPCGYSGLSDSRTLRVGAYAQYYKEVIPNVLPAYDAAIYHSATYKDYQYAQEHGFKNSVVIPNFVDEEEFDLTPTFNFREKYGIRTRYMLLSVGNFFAEKRHKDLIEVFVKMKCDDATLVLIGKDAGCLESLREQAAGLPVKFLTDIPRHETVAAFKCADLFLFASRVEASPLVIIEAKAARLPFVSTDCGNISEFKGGVICDVNHIGVHANRLLQDEGLRNKLGQEGWKEWSEKLTTKAIIDRYEGLYFDLLELKQPRKVQIGSAA